MALHISLALFSAACCGLAAVAVQCIVLRRHMREPPAVARSKPPISILKPLCGLDDSLEANLAVFAQLNYPEYEVVLGLRSARDPAWQVACSAARRWPGRFRVVLQRGEPGLNPKVNQLVTLAWAARHDILVVSDSNVRVSPGYLDEIAALLEDERVGLVTHPIVGVGEARLGSLLDHLHLTSCITPAVLAAGRLAGRDIVVGKSMALRRADLRALGGFEVVKDVLAEDYVMGRMVSGLLGKRVELGRQPVQNVSEHRTLSEFVARYRRWGVLQRQSAGPLVYACGALLNPVLLAAAATAVACTPSALAALAGACAVKTALDGVAARTLRAGGFPLRQLALVPFKDLVFGAVWAFCFVRRDVAWRGTRIVVQRGTRIEAPGRGEPHATKRASPPTSLASTRFG
jgi:ceramide glucosyltransferase